MLAARSAGSREHACSGRQASPFRALEDSSELLSVVSEGLPVAVRWWASTTRGHLERRRERRLGGVEKGDWAAA